MTGADTLSFDVSNNNPEFVVLTQTTLSWTDFYHPDQYVDYFRFDGTLYWSGNGFDSPTSVNSNVGFIQGSTANWKMDFDGYGWLYGYPHTIGPFTLELTFNGNCTVTATIPPVVSNMIIPSSGQVITDISQTAFRAESWDTGVGTNNGDGIDLMHLVLLGPDQSLIVNRSDTAAPYCVWGNANPCPLMSQSLWDSLPNGTYTLIAWGRSAITGSWSPPVTVQFTLARTLLPNSLP